MQPDPAKTIRDIFRPLEDEESTIEDLDSKVGLLVMYSGRGINNAPTVEVFMLDKAEAQRVLNEIWYAEDDNFVRVGDLDDQIGLIRVTKDLKLARVISPEDLK
jgi:hypothetical protein